METRSWHDEVHGVFRELNIGLAAYVPDTGQAKLIRLVQDDADIRAVALTTEEEGVALAAGAWLGGQRTALLVQSSGAGNCINMLGMLNECRIPLVMVVTMRGGWGEFNPWQIPMAAATAPALEAIGVLTYPVDQAAEVAPTVGAAARLAYNTGRVVAVLISQRVVGAKEFK